MKKIKYLLLLILFIPLNTFAITQNDKYFNLEFPSTFHDDFTNLQFGANTDLKDVLDELMSYHNNYKNLTLIVYYNANGFYRLNVYLSPLDSVNSVSIFGQISGSSLTINNTISFSKGSVRYQFATSNSSTSLLDSVAFSSIKDCLENNICTTTRPTETTYDGTYSFVNSNSSVSNTNYIINNFDDSLDYNISNLNLLYYSDVNFTLVPSSNTSYYVRNIKYNDMNIDYYSFLPSYVDYVNIPDNPDIDTDVGFWKNHVYWFVDNNSEYGVLVNLYILFFISVIGTSFIAFIKLIKKSRW